MTDFSGLFAAIEKWKHEHPEYEQARKLIDEANRMIKIYEDAVNPPPIVIADACTKLYPTHLPYRYDMRTNPPPPPADESEDA